MSRLSIRARLAISYAAAMLAVLAVGGLFTYVYLGDQLQESLDTSLRARGDDLATLAATSARSGSVDLSALPSSEEGFSQLLRPDGGIISSTLEGSDEPVLDPEEIRRAISETVVVERPVAGVEGEARILARPVVAGEESLLAVVAASTDDRREALTVLSTAFLIGAPIAVLVASLVGYLLAGRAMRPVAAIRERAEQISLAASGERVPTPAAQDEIRELAETLNAMLARIERGIERERVFVADASHELRTPLANLSAELELAGRPGRGEADLRGAIASGAEEVERLSSLAEDLLVIARAEGGRMPIKLETVEVATLLERVASRFQGRAGDRSIAVEEGGCGIASLDPQRVEQALGNCVDNALRHGIGTIGLRCIPEPAGVTLEVTDEGPGIPKDFAAEAFERFSRAERGRTSEGSGLGLAIVRLIARAHGGEASVAGRSGQGTAVRIFLPSARPH